MFLDIYRYDSAINFLQDYYNSRKESEDLTLRDWAAEMNLESPVLLVDILKKKRPLKLKYISFLKMGLKLDENQALYFQTLIQMSKSSEDEKEYFMNLLNSMKPYAPVNPEGDVFSHWINGAILALGKAKNFSLNARNIQNSLGPHVNLTDINNSLTLLFEKGLLKKEANGSFTRMNPEFVSTNNDTSIDSTKQYYRQVIKKAQDAVESPVNEREFQCFSICTNQNNVQKMKDILRDSRRELAALYDENGDSLFQFNLMGFSMGKIEKEEVKGDKIISLSL